MGILLFHDAIRKMKKSLISFTILTSVVASGIVSQDLDNLEQLPFCGDEYSRTISRRLLYVTTLDGKLTALDLARNGKVHWELPTSPGPLISSSIHRLELTNNGQLVRMIPSLSGGIYKFDGETIDPIPITVENLLSSSFKFSDDLVISGGKETRSYGISARTGQILYECSMHGCINETETSRASESVKTSNDINNQEHDSLLDDVVIVRRQTQTVRAIEPRTGNERWNFSVGQHEVEVLKSPECHDRPLNKLDVLTLDMNIKVIVPDGIICAFSKTNPNLLLWKHQFDHPIVSAWKTESNEEVKTIDLFGSAQWVWNTNQEDMMREGFIAPSIYLGMYQKQLYIQESLKLQKLLTDKTNRFDYHLIENDGNNNLPTIPWRPLPATKSTSIIMLENNVYNYNDDYGTDQDDSEISVSVTALSVLYASEYVNGNGFYLFTENDLNKTSTALCAVTNSTNPVGNDTNDDFLFDFDDSDTQVKEIIISIWDWWKEILVISLTTGLLLNILLSPKIRPERQILVIERHIAVPTAFEATEESMNSFCLKTQRSVSESTNNTSNDNFTSRFQSDFDMVQCLGKGGFGVVFEAKNKLDSCTYAVKRITLPYKKEKRERVMREVKTLATSEHPNIVRYFQAWVETPPPGWQEEEDAKWSNRDFSTTSIEIETPDGTTLPSLLKNSNYISGAGCDYNNKKRNLNSWISKINETDHSSAWDNNYNYNEKNNAGNNDDDADDSFIQFKSESDDKSNNNQYNSFLVNIHSKDCFDFSNTKMEKTINSINKNDNSDSFEIEFQHSENHNKNDIQNGIHWNSNYNDSELSKSLSTPPKKFGHKRPLSLDLTSKYGVNSNALIPLHHNNQNNLLSEISKSQHQLATLQLPKKLIQNKHYLYIQMQLCRKESLREWLREHCIEMRQPHIQSIFHQIVDAVDYVHRRNLIHRDLKPSNIFFSLDGQIRVGDFGLVTDMPETPNSSNSDNSCSTGSVNVLKLPSYRHTQQVGTHLYMSPEQLHGHSYDNSVDIYSLGLIFFELLVYFGTEMERIKTLKGLRDCKFPMNFQNQYPDEHDLLKLMLSKKATDRPPTNIIKDKLLSMTSWIDENLKNVDTGKIRRLSEMSSSS